MAEPSPGRLLCCGIRGARAGDPDLERDLEACCRAGVGAVVLFDVDLPRYRELLARGLGEEDARLGAPRNVLDPTQLRQLISYLREYLGESLLVCIDQEGGEVARLSPRRGFPAEPGAAEFACLDIAAQREAAHRQATGLAELGIDLNFAPCVDLALEPQNEIIAGKGRSFGSDPERVLECARIVLEEHAEAGVAACLKHFPGHGSSRGDSHRGAVDITSSWRRDAELRPYRGLLGDPGVAVMVGHLIHRELDPRLPASLSPAQIGDLLRGELGFDGVVVTDSLDMRAIRDRLPPEEAALAAVEAGADLVVDAFNLDERAEHPAPGMQRALQDALDSGRLSQKRLQASLRRLDALNRR